MQTLGEVVALIRAMAKSENEVLAKHGASLLGKRTCGSTTDVGLEDVDGETPIYDSTPSVTMYGAAQPGCLYLHFLAPGIGGQLVAEPYCLVKRERPQLEIKRREGVHGPELYIDVPLENNNLPKVAFGTIVLGPENEYPEFPNGVIYTWHPGWPMKSLRSIDEKPTDFTAVKLHNG